MVLFNFLFCHFYGGIKCFVFAPEVFFLLAISCCGCISLFLCCWAAWAATPVTPPPPLLPLVALPPSPPVHALVCFWAFGVLEDGVDHGRIGLRRLFRQPEFLYGES